MEIIEKSINNSTCYSAILDGNFIGFAKIITNKSTFAYLADFFILTKYQKQKFGSMFLEFVLKDKDIRVYLLALNGHNFYKQFWFIQDEGFFKSVMRKPIFV